MVKKIPRKDVSNPNSVDMNSWVGLLAQDSCLADHSFHASLLGEFIILAISSCDWIRTSWHGPKAWDGRVTWVSPSMARVTSWAYACGNVPELTQFSSDYVH